MTPLEFLQVVWPVVPAREGFYCLAFPLEAGGFSHSVFETIEAAAAYAEKVKGSKNVYFATHVLRQEMVWNKEHHKLPKSKEWVAGWSVRLQKNMLVGKDFFFDIDVAKSKDDYPTQIDALIALKQFVVDCNLPKPMLISSGNGIHVHWIVSEALDSNSEWKTQAQRLRQLALHHKLKIDTHRTIDTSSVLRVPETFNLKKGLKLHVELLSRPEIITPASWAKRLTAALEAIDLNPAPECLPDDEMGSNISREFAGNLTPPTGEAVFENCGQLARIRAAHGDLREPEWHAALGALQFAENGRALCHEISREHPNYEKSYVDAKIDRWHFGPTSCAKLALDSGAAHKATCESCPHVALNKGPVSIARLMEKAPPPTVIETVGSEEVVREIPDPPLPYKRSKNGAIEILLESKNGSNYLEEILPYDIYPIDLVSDDPAETSAQTWRVHLPHGKVKDFTLAAADFVDEKALRTRLANIGVYCKSYGKLGTYMSAYVMMLQNRAAAQVQCNHLGWIDDMSAFVLPQGVIKTDGSVNPVSLGVPASDAKAFIKKRGSLRKQVELMDFYKDKRYVANQFFIGCGLASILYPFTGHYGVIVHAAGLSGASKSSGLFTAASFWGRPEDYVVDGREDGSTVNYRSSRVHMLSNLPFMLDEITLIAHDVAKSMALGASQKPPKGRLNSDASEKKAVSSDKSLIMMTTANVSFYSLLAHQNNAGTAAAVRVFELTFERLGIHETWDVNAYMRELKENYGWIGEEFTKFVLANRDKVRARVIAVQDQLEREGHMQPDERFWFAVAAAVLVGLDIAHRLGLLLYDTAMVRQWLLEHQLPRLRGDVHDEMIASAPLTLLTDYIAEKHGDIVKHGSRTDSTFHIPANRLLGHYDPEIGELLLLKEGFKHWCSLRNQYAQPLLRQLLRDGIVSTFDAKRTLGAGTSLAKGLSLCFIVNMAHPAVAAGEVKEKLMASNVVPIKGVKR